MKTRVLIALGLLAVVAALAPTASAACDTHSVGDSSTPAEADLTVCTDEGGHLVSGSYDGHVLSKPFTGYYWVG